MRMKVLLAALGAFLIASIASAQTTVTARAGIDDGVYRFVEVINQQDNGILTGAGYVDTGDPRDYTNLGTQQEVYAGAGYAFEVAGVSVLAIGFLDRTTGDAAQTTVVPWVVGSRQLGRAIASGNYFIYTPADGEGDVLQVVENAKVEYPLGSRWLAGVGIAATKAGEAEWQERPFLTATYKASAGNFELWALRGLQSEVSFQLRYQRTFGD